MNLFLTSSPTGDYDGQYTCDGIDNRNKFADCLKEVWRHGARVLMISGFPKKISTNEQMRSFFRARLLKSGFALRYVDLWDERTLEAGPEAYSKEKLHEYDMIILGGGHVPTEHAFFEELNLREHMVGYEGIVMGISAGSMNCADVVYAQPELAGEAVDPHYERFITGLGLTDINILPHYQVVKDEIKDGLKLFEDITIPDSKGRKFVIIPDGSFVHIHDGKTYVHGESYLAQDGVMKTFSVNNQIRELNAAKRIANVRFTP